METLGIPKETAVCFRDEKGMKDAAARLEAEAAGRVPAQRTLDDGCEVNAQQRCAAESIDMDC